MKNDQHLWNFLTIVLFAGLFLLSLWWLYTTDTLPTEIVLFDFVLIILAVFRLIRLVSDDIIFQWFRELFLVEGEIPKSGARRTITELINCPWCIGVWLALLVSFFYYATEFAWYPILVLAIAGGASFVRVLAKRISS